MELINQPNNYGCGFACIAMISGISYEEAEEYYGKQVIGEGITDNVIWYILSHLGYVSRIVLHANYEGDDFPIEIGNWDIWRVNMGTGGHYVVRVGNEIYDPGKSEVQNIKDYTEPSAIIGVINLNC